MRAAALGLMLLALPAWADDALIAQAKSAVTKDFKDPYSAVFEGVFIGKGANGSPVVCGTVNAKNSYGAYSGRKRFYYVAGIAAVVESGSSKIVYDGAVRGQEVMA